MAKFDNDGTAANAEVKKYCDLTIEDMNDKGLEIPEELLDLLNQLPYSVCDQHRFGPDVIANAFESATAHGSFGEENTYDLRDYVYFGIPADKYIGECVDLVESIQDYAEYRFDAMDVYYLTWVRNDYEAVVKNTFPEIKTMYGYQHVSRLLQIMIDRLWGIYERS